MDQLGLVHLNGRIYDPFLGRFLSPDPEIQDPSHSQSYNRYTYVWNNPTNDTDPTGFLNEKEITQALKDGKAQGVAKDGTIVGLKATFNADGTIATLTVTIPGESTTRTLTYNGVAAGSTFTLVAANGVTTAREATMAAVANPTANFSSVEKAMYGSPTLSQSTVDFSGGAGDVMTWDVGHIIREKIGIASVDTESKAYLGGEVAGTLVMAATGKAGGGGALEAGAKQLSRDTKGMIGEALSLAKNLLKGSKLVGTQVEEQGFRTVFDSKWISKDGILYYVESKFGTGPLSPAQREARKILGDSYRVERWGYDFVRKAGSWMGFAGGAAEGATVTTANQK